MHVLQPWCLTTLNCVFLHSLLCSLWWFSNCHIFRPLTAWEEPWRYRQQSLNIHSIIFRQSQASSEEAYAGQYWVYMFQVYYLWELVHPIPQLLMFATTMVSLFHYGLLSSMQIPKHPFNAFPLFPDELSCAVNKKQPVPLQLFMWDYAMSKQAAFKTTL